MGWISDRHMKSGGSIGPGGIGEEKRGAPLRKIVKVLSPRLSMFGKDRVLFECGHAGFAYGCSSARCIACKAAARTP